MLRLRLRFPKLFASGQCLPSDGLFDRRGDRWGDPGHFVSSHSKLYLWGVLGFPPPTFRGRVEGTNLYWAPGMECRREPWCVTKIVKTTLQVLKPSKLSVITLKTIEVNFARLGWRDAPRGAPEAHSILGPRGENFEKTSEVTFSSFFSFFRCTSTCQLLKYEEKPR